MFFMVIIYILTEEDLGKYFKFKRLVLHMIDL
jgi:hypothetical protein